jgi:hypothetical protein
MLDRSVEICIMHGAYDIRFSLSLVKGKTKGILHPRTGHEVPEWE